MESCNDQLNSKLLHIVVVGFHHKKGCQIEYAYPPLVPGTKEDSGEVPPEWKHLPSLALPDGSHNFSKDTVYFHLKDAASSGRKCQTVYGVSCYRQIDAKEVVNKTEDITRGTVQKSICVLTTLPFYGAIAMKLELVTHAWFEQKDFTKVDLLKDAYTSLNASLSHGTQLQSQAMMGLQLCDVVKMYGYKILVLFKLLMLERKTVFFMTPVSDLCNVILSIISLFPGLLEQGLVESVENAKTRLISPTLTERKLGASGDEDPFIEINYSETDKLIDSDKMESVNSSQTEKFHTHADKGSYSSNTSCETSNDESSKTQEIPELDSADFMKQIDLEDQVISMWANQKPSLVISSESVLDEQEPNQSGIMEAGKSRNHLHLDLNSGNEITIIPVVSPTSITIDNSGLPLAIFTKGSVCHPYLSLAYYDILEDVNIRSFLIGASNVLFKQKKNNVDVIVEDNPNAIVVHDKELAKQLQLSTEDLRFADMICRRVDAQLTSDEFCENFVELEERDEWIRSQFKDYLLSLMATVLAEDGHLLEAFNPHFINAWKTTHNYKVWRSTVQHLEVIPGHPCMGGVSLTDLKLQMARSERGRRINAAVDQAGKVVTDTTKALGGAVKSYITSWWANAGKRFPGEE